MDRNNVLTGKENIFSSGTQTILFINQESQLKDKENSFENHIEEKANNDELKWLEFVLEQVKK